MKKYPAGFPFLFMTEVWERFGFYIVQGLLALYMTRQFNFSDAKSYNVLGAFTALAYIAPVVGGYLADKLLGFKKAVLLGGVLLFTGYLLLAVSYHEGFYLALAMIVVGTGFLKPNVSSLLGTLYSEDDPKRNAGFTIFYVGIYVGVLLATLLIGFVHKQFGWQVSFGLASTGMIFAIITFLSGRKPLAPYGNTSKPFSFIKLISITSIVYLAMVLSAWAAIEFHQLTNIFFALFGITLAISLFFLTRQLKSTERQQVRLLLVLYIFSGIFWALYFQTFFSLTLFIERDIDRVIYGSHIPTITFLAFIPTFIIIFGPLFAKIWTHLKEKQRDLSLPTKFACGLILTGLGFLVIASSGYFIQTNGLVSPWWIMVSYFLISLGELFISPTGLAMVTELAPVKLTGLLMGVWFFSLGVGGQLAGVIAKWTAIPHHITSTLEQITLYQQGFFIYAAIGIAAGLLLLLGKVVYNKCFKNCPV